MTIRVYTAPDSGWCEEARAFLRANRTSFQEIDVTRDRKLLDEMESLSGQVGVPVTTDGKTVVIGFDPQALGRLIANAH